MEKIIYGKKNNERVSSRILEEEIKSAVWAGHRNLVIKAYGQHGIGGRLFAKEPITVTVEGATGQRAGSLGYPNTIINIMGPVSDDVGWLNAGAEIIVHGNAGNGAANAMAQGKIYIGGNIGARGMTMTKHNPKFTPPELWVLGSAGDYFGEFMAGGIAVICGYEAQNPQNILGYRPLIGMVGGKVFVRNKTQNFSIEDSDWQWLIDNMAVYLKKINKEYLFTELTKRDEWRLITASPSSRGLTAGSRMPMAKFKTEIWDKELGDGGLLGDITNIDRSPIPFIVTGDLRHYIPKMEHKDKCVNCKICIKTCPQQAISADYVIDDNKCIGCGFCKDICPHKIWR